MLQVRFAEVNRNALQQAGIALFVTRSSWAGRSSTGGSQGPEFDEDDLVFTDFLNLFFFQRDQGVGAVAEGAAKVAASCRAWPSRT